MKKIVSLLVMLAFAMSSLLMPGSLAAQSNAVATEDMVLTIAEGEGWSFAQDADKQPIVEMVPMMIDGEPQLEFSPAVLDLYQQHQMMDAYAWSADVLPENYEPVSTTIEIRVMTFADAENATAFLDVFYGQLVELSAPEANVMAIDPLPESDLNMLGITSMVDFTNYESGDSMGMAGSARYLAQAGDTVISVEVTGPLVDYNFDVAYSILDSQVSCIDAGGACDSVTMPTMDGRWTLTEKGIVFATDGDAENEWARWIFPLEEPVTAPEWSVTLP